ncbi:MAG: secretin N-terminal domain-containing protein [Terracidiphilus sp.]
MRSISDATARRIINRAQMLGAITLALLLAHPAYIHAQSADTRTAEPTASTETYQTIYLVNMTQQNDLNDVQTALRNMLGRAKIFGVPSQNAITIRGSAEDVQLAQKICADLDRPKKVYRLTYTIHDAESAQHADARHFALVVSSGGKATFKQGSKVPIVTGNFDVATSSANSQVQYQDVGLNIEAGVDAYADGGLRLRSRIELSSLAEEKSGVGAQDPVMTQTLVDGTARLTPGKPFVLGSIEVPGSTRQQEIEVVADLVQ